jgi:hypothetical protein
LNLCIINRFYALRLLRLQLLFLSLLSLDLSLRFENCLSERRLSVRSCTRQELLELLDAGLFPGNLLPDSRERVLHLEKLPAGHENPLLLQLQSRNEKLHADARTRGLMDLCSERAHFRKQSGM